MRHHNTTKKFGRVRKVRTGFVRSLLVNLIEQERITTTAARAKAIRPMIEKLVTKARKGDVAARRLVAARLGNNLNATKKLVDEIAPRYTERPGGYTRITKMPQRSGDAAHMAVIEFVEVEKKAPAKKAEAEKADA
jgi:large subunit ribosomal protein L17